MTRSFRPSRLVAVAGFIFLLAACAAPAPPPPPDTHDADVQAIKDLEAQWNRDYAARDMEKIAGYYTADATIMGPGMAPASGTGAIQEMLKGMLADPALDLKFQAGRVEVSKSGDLAFTQGTYTMSMTDPKTKKVIHDAGTYVTGYRKQADGSWKAVSDIATSGPAPEPAAVKK